MPTLVSIIIPTYNRAGLVGTAIESALAQTYPATEVVVVDDGSTDETPAVLAGFGGRIRTIRTANRGCAAARNAGIAAARGDYLAFVDSDDAAPPDKLALQAPILDRSSEVGFVYGPSVAFGPELPSDQVLLPVRPDADGSVFEGLFLTTRIGFDSVLLRRLAVERAGGFDETLLHNEDTDLLLRVALDWQAVCLDTPCGRHRWHPGRKSRDEVALRRAVLTSMERVLAARPEFRDRLGPRAALRFAEVRREVSRALAARGDVAQARAESDAAWRLHRSVALAAWGRVLRIPPLVPAFLWSERFLARCLGFLLSRLAGR